MFNIGKIQHTVCVVIPCLPQELTQTTYQSEATEKGNLIHAIGSGHSLYYSDSAVISHDSYASTDLTIDKNVHTKHVWNGTYAHTRVGSLLLCVWVPHSSPEGSELASPPFHLFAHDLVVSKGNQCSGLFRQVPIKLQIMQDIACLLKRVSSQGCFVVATDNIRSGFESTKPSSWPLWRIVLGFSYSPLGNVHPIVTSKTAE